MYREYWDKRARKGLDNIIPVQLREGFFTTGIRDVYSLLYNLPRPTNYTILDLGCGIGRMLYFLAPLCKQAIGLDVSIELLARASKLLSFHKNVSLIVGAGETLYQFRDQTFDLVSSFACFQHLPKKTMINYFREIYRVLKRKGYFKFNLPYCKSKDHPDYIDKVEDSFLWRSRFYLKEEIKDLLERIGYKDISYQPETSYIWTVTRREI